MLQGCEERLSPTSRGTPAAAAGRSTSGPTRNRRAPRDALPAGAVPARGGGAGGRTARRAGSLKVSLSENLMTHGDAQGLPACAGS